MTDQKVVIVKPLHHREKDCYGIYSKKDFELIKLVKEITDVKFSATNSCWYAPTQSTNFGEILKVFKNNAWVDLSAYKKASDNKEQQELVIKLPVKSSTAESIPLKPLPKKPQGLNPAHLQALRMVEQKLILKGYTINTRKTYLQQFKEFMLFYNDADLIELTEIEIRNYLLYLIQHKKLSKSTQNQAINAIKFFYEKVMLQERRVYHLERPMRDKKLPEILSQREVMAIFNALDNIKHRCLLMLTYAAGLRRSEVLNLRIGDVDFDRNVVFIRGGKGRKDRQSVMAQSLIPLLEQYMQDYCPQFWLFEGHQARQPYTASSLRNVLKKGCFLAGIKKHVRLHMLRHSFATHLLEGGTSTRYIQVLLGHESPKTTELYAQVTRFGLDKVVSPLDQIAISKRLRDGDE